MKFKTMHTVVLLSQFAVLTMFASGCGNNAGPTKGRGPGRDTGGTVANGTADDSGWWCLEHGVPEEECSMCNAKVAAEFKKKGDWCKEHDRAESQCFICNPERAEKFAARYEAKFGQRPPAPEENMRRDQVK